MLGLLLCLTACGGGGGGGAGSATYFVRATAGSDRNDGRSPATAFSTIQAAVNRARAGDRIVVGSGRYTSSGDVVVEVGGRPGAGDAPIEIFADTRGTLTGDVAGDVVVDAAGRLFGFRFTNAAFVVVDGFTIVGTAVANSAGIQTRDNSRNITIRHCTITDNGDGVRVEDSSDVLLFNNLVFTNRNRGVQIGTGARDTRLVNNTIALNQNDGISSSGGGVRGTFLRNNLILENQDRGIDVDASATSGYDADYDLVFPLFRNAVPVAYGPSTPTGIHDINIDPELVDTFRLSQFAAGQETDSAAVDAADPDTDPQLVDALRARTTATNNAVDLPPADIGFHFPGLSAPPPTRTRPAVTLSPPTVTPRPVRATLYVRASAGSDANDGSSPSSALKTIRAAVQRAVAGVRIVVGTGVYAESIILSPPGGDAENPIVLFADVSGLETGDAAGEVVVNTGFSGRGFFVDGASYVTIDGFTITDTSTAGIHIRRQATNVTVQNCEIVGNREDGIRVQDSDDVTLFNNLIYCNARRGILVDGTGGSKDTLIIGNTITKNADRGIFIGSSSAASPGSFLRNNIFEDNGGNEIQVVTDPTNSLKDYDADYNLVFPPNEFFGAAPGPNDVLSGPARFVDVAECAPLALHEDDYRLSQTLAGQSPPDSPAVRAGDPETPIEFVEPLRLRSTATAGFPDAGRTDLGYHFPR